MLGVDLRNGTVGGVDLRDGGVSGQDVADGSLTGSDIKDGGISGRDIAAGVIPSRPAVSVRVGQPATAGTNGIGGGCVDGVPGGSKGYRDAGGALVNGGCGGGAGGSSEVTVQCEAGEVATGGGYIYQAGKRHALVTASSPSPAGAGQTPTGWRVKVETLTNDSSNDTPVTPYAVCMRP